MALTDGLVALPVSARPRIDGRWWFWLRRVMRDLTPAIALYAVYGLFRIWQPAYAPDAAFRNASDLTAFQTATGLDIDRGWQIAALGHHWLITFANWFYIVGWAPVLLAVVLFAFVRAPVVLERWRIVLTMTATATAILQVAWPLAPPRIYAPYGMIDTLMTYGPTYYGTVGDQSGAINVYGAMPSMHVGWSLLAALIMRAVLPGRWWVTALGGVYVGSMTWTVVVTGNHYLLDPIVGILIVVLALAVGRVRNGQRIGQLRRRSATLPS